MERILVIEEFSNQPESLLEESDMDNYSYLIEKYINKNRNFKIVDESGGTIYQWKVSCSK